ncbi:filamentous hemagglutinin N-terminal domain-containing protein [Allocoleopsis sp.]|uniref:two-partner secretion domain-containing protein n=1 Tax=Allocoleopsis sp. TaxID=3088169 RepID=UPI002FD31367
MTSIWQCLCWKVGLANARASAIPKAVRWVSIALIVTFGNCAEAEIIPDGTLGSTVDPLNNNDVPSILITGGTRLDNTLFHSFGEFTVQAGQTALFTHPAGIENILTRVTGSNPSNILGTLGVTDGSVTGGNANLFLINPKGISFGPNARLLLNGSFVATTANAIALSNGDIFSTNPAAPLPSQLLNVNPNALFFNQIPAQPIVSQARLSLAPGNSLLFVGGDVRLEGGILQAPGGRVELGGVAAPGNVALNVNGNSLSLNFPTDVVRTDVSITNAAGINVVNGGSGSIAINARNIDVLDRSYLSAGRILSDTNNSQPGDITLNATGAINIFNGSSVLNVILGSGTGGNVKIDTGQLVIRDGVVGSSSLSNQNRGGNLLVNASQSVEVTGTTVDGRVSINTAIGALQTIPIGLFTAPLGAGGSAGDMTIQTGRLLVQGGARLAVGTDNQNPGGTLTIQASDLVELIGTSANGTPTIVASGTQGNGRSGDVTIDTRRLVVRDGAIVTTGTSSEGQGGQLTVRASESVELLGTAAVTLDDTSLQRLIGASLSPFLGVRPLPSGLIAATVGAGKSGDLTIETGRLVIQGGAQASTSTGSLGNGGELRVQASEIELSGISQDGFFSSGLSIDSRGAGDAGNLSIITRQMTLRDGGQVLASASGTGRAGTLEVNASDSVQVIGTATNGKPSSLLFDTSGSGNAGNLKITTGRLIVQDGGQVSAGTTGTGQGGTLNVNASDFVEVRGTSADGQTPSRLLFDTSNAGDAGELKITTSTLRVRDGGQVSARTSGTGRGGVLQVAASNEVEVSGTSANGQFASGLYFDTSSAANARGITIDTGRLVIQDGGQVTVSGTGSGAAGDLEVNAGSIFLNNQGKLSATTTSGEGGNIQLRVEDFISLRRNSEISTEASGTGNGGNINMDTGGFVVAILSENSDIVANAFQGRGGNISARARGIYGFRRFENRRTPESDFTASSQVGLDGVVEIDVRNEPQAIPLPEKVVSTEIDPVCQASQGQNHSEFIITGRGGLPDNPSGTLNHDAVWTDLRTPTTVSTIQGEESVTSRTPTTQLPIVEANGWVINNKGEVVLTASAPNVTPHSPNLTPQDCYVP